MHHIQSWKSRIGSRIWKFGKVRSFQNFPRHSDNPRLNFPAILNPMQDEFVERRGKLPEVIPSGIFRECWFSSAEERASRKGDAQENALFYRGFRGLCPVVIFSWFPVLQKTAEFAETRMVQNVPVLCESELEHCF